MENITIIVVKDIIEETSTVNFEGANGWGANTTIAQNIGEMGLKGDNIRYSHPMQT